MNAADRLAYEIEQEQILEQRRESAEQARKSAEEALRRRTSPADGLVDRTTVTEPPEPRTVTAPKVAPNETQIWWQWTQAQISDLQAKLKKHIARERSEIEANYKYEFEVLSDATGQALGERCRDVRDDLRREINLVKSEVKQMRELVERERGLNEKAAEVERARYEAELTALRHEVEILREGSQRDDNRSRQEVELLQRQIVGSREQAERERELNEKAAEVERTQYESLQREVETLREQIAFQSDFEDLRKQVVVAKAEIPRVPDIEARVEVGLSRMAAEQKRLESELEKTRKRVSKMRVDQSVTEFSVKKLEEAQQPVIELKFESVDGTFSMKENASPDAVEAWRRFCKELVEATDITMTPNDPTGRVVALSSSKAGAA